MEQHVRYCLYRGETLIKEHLCDAPERWYTVHEMTLMLEATGFVVEQVTGNYSDAPVINSNYVFAFFARRPV